ncbi:hypothetical protein DLL80_23800 [Salmonella enterica subsp. enterica serovar Newport]|uniref:Uncharacterized protein n=1 Tax=Salmonella newport TaxID=108619 RepID=A0A5V6RMI0_SALNE|nr:hypothetical protein [Salmonella enterica subsp. enterica serovar Newport]
MDFDKMIADGMINIVVDEKTNQKYYVWSEKVERPVIPFVKENQYIGKECRRCGSKIRYDSTNKCVICSRERDRKNKAILREKAKAVAND